MLVLSEYISVVDTENPFGPFPDFTFLIISFMFFVRT